jgi:hypothetical protein
VSNAKLPLSSWWVVLIDGPHATQGDKMLPLLADGRVEDPPGAVDVYRCPCCEQRSVFSFLDDAPQADALEDHARYELIVIDRRVSVITYRVTDDTDDTADVATELALA